MWARLYSSWSPMARMTRLGSRRWDDNHPVETTIFFGSPCPPQVCAARTTGSASKRAEMWKRIITPPPDVLQEDYGRSCRLSRESTRCLQTWQGACPTSRPTLAEPLPGRTEWWNRRDKVAHGRPA